MKSLALTSVCFPPHFLLPPSALAYFLQKYFQAPKQHLPLLQVQAHLPMLILPAQFMVLITFRS